ncbi:MAG: heme exporter protein CcmB, partial [Actinomycetota bacterium]
MRTRIAVAVARKDLRIEANSRVLTNQVAPFSAVVMVMFAFALDNDGILQRVAPGLVWLAVLFSMLVVVQRGFSVETADGALDTLRVAGVDPSALSGAHDFVATYRDPAFIASLADVQGPRHLADEFEMVQD